MQLPNIITDGISTPLIAFLNANDRETVANLSTAQPTTNVETLYYGSPTSISNRYPIFQFSATETGNQVYVSKSGNGVAYFRSDPTGTKTGLYILNVPLGFS